jgi:hypothetical protein
MRNLPRRLERLEVRAKKIARAMPEPHTLCFVDMDKRVVSKYEMGTGKWTHFTEGERPLAAGLGGGPYIPIFPDIVASLE